MTNNTANLIAAQIIAERHDDISTRSSVTWYLDEAAEYDARLADDDLYTEVWTKIVNDLGL